MLRTIATACLAFSLIITGGCGGGSNFAPGGGAGGGGTGGGGGNGTSPSLFVFVSNTASNSISGFAIDKSSGALMPVPGSPFTTVAQPAGLAADPSGNFLVVANNGGQVSVFRINRTTGSLSTVMGSPFSGHGQPRVVAIYKNTVYVGNQGSNDISAYALDASSGALTEIPGSPFSSGSIAVQSLVVDVTVGLPVPVGGTPALLVVGGTGLANYRIASNGTLTPLNTAAGGAYSWVTAKGGYLYVTSSNGITVYDEHTPLGDTTDCDPTNEFLACSVGSYAAGSLLSSVAANPSDTLVIVADLGSAEVKAFSVTPGVFTGTSGTLTQIDSAPTGTGPFSLAIDASGKFLYVANQDSAGVSAYGIDPTTFKLGEISGSPFATGQGPTFLITVQ
jgi:6-phosphogluconolactonase